MFIYNCWYVAAMGREVETGKVFARTILNQPVVFYRKADGHVAALEDRCCHRLVPLSLGTVVENTLQCGYHGFRFDEAGRCIKIPGQSKIPSGAKVRSYPIVERHGFIWIWPGDVERAVDESTIPAALSVLDKEGWDARTSYIHVKAGYRLIVDNLHDGSHGEFVHTKTLRVEGIGEAMRDSGKQSYKFEVIDGNIQHSWRILNAPGASAFVKGFCLQNGIDYETARTKPVNWSLETIWYAPVTWTFDPVTYLSGDAPETAATWTNIISITPETEHTTHYFWGDAQNHDPNDARIAEFYHGAVNEAFMEDVVVFEAQQRILGTRDVFDFNPIVAGGDAASIQARRILADMKAREGGAAVPADRRQ